MVNVAEVLVARLVAVGVTQVFGVVGGAIEPFMNAIAKEVEKGSLQYIAAKHESAAVYMAAGYYHATGKVAAVIATSGPGLTNLLTGLATASSCRIPMFVYIGASSLAHAGDGALQGEEVVGMKFNSLPAGCTKMCVTMTHAAQVHTYATAQQVSAHQYPKGPACLVLPLDVQKNRCNSKEVRVCRTFGTEEAPQHVFGNLLTAVQKNRNILLVVGEGMHDAVADIETLAHALNAWIAVTPDAKGFVRTNASRFLGVLGFAGHTSVYTCLDERPDIILALGVRCTEWTTLQWSPLLLNDRLVAIHDDVTAYIHQSEQGVFIHMKPQLFCTQLLHCLKSSVKLEEKVPVKPVPLHYDSNFVPEKPVHPILLMQSLSHHISKEEKAVVYPDAGNSLPWSVHYLSCTRSKPVTKPWFYMDTEFAPMGIGIGMSVGYGCHDRSARVYALIGDGSMLMNGQELLTALEHSIPVVFIILNDRGYGMVRHGQKLGGAASIGNIIPPVDFSLLSQALGVESVCILSNAEMRSFDFGVLPKDKPFLIEVMVDREAVPPMGGRVAMLNQSSESEEVDKNNSQSQKTYLE